jgi:hypothetical protein
MNIELKRAFARKQGRKQLANEILDEGLKTKKDSNFSDRLPVWLIVKLLRETK